MRVLLIFCFVLLSAIPAFSAELQLKQDSGPSYEETIEFIADTIKSAKYKYYLHEKNVSTLVKGQYVYSIIQLEKCRAKLVTVDTAGFENEGKMYYPNPPSRIETGIDVSKILKVTSASRTFDSEPEAKVSFKSNGGFTKDWEKRGPVNDLTLYQENLDAAERLAKAFRHLAKLCGSDIKPDKPSPF